LNLKKSINFEENLDDKKNPNYSLNILNKECYILSFYEKIFLISLKYLEIIATYNLHFNLHFNIKSVFVSSNSNIILMFKKLREEKMTMPIYKLYKKELKFVGKKEYNNKKIIDIREINEKGDHILLTNSYLNFNFKNGEKKISKLYYIKNINKKNNKNIKKDYSMFKMKKENYNENYFLNDNDDNDYDEEYYFYYSDDFSPIPNPHPNPYLI